MTRQSVEKDRWRNGARVSFNTDRLLRRSNEAAFLAGLPARARPESHPDGIALAQAHPKKGWAKRYLRARGLPL